MKKETTNRSRFTQDCLLMALEQLLKEKPIDDITVSEITSLAGVSRTTFYRNYDSIEDILSEYFINFPFGALSDTEYSDKETWDLKQRLRNSFTFLYEARDLLNSMLNSNLQLILYNNYDSLMKGLYRPRVWEMGFRTKYGFSAAGGLYYAICYDWIKDGMVESIDEMVEITYRILKLFDPHDDAEYPGRENE